MILRSTETHGNLLPSIINLVHSLPDEIVHNERYGYRNPKLIAIRSLSRIFDAFNEVYIQNDLVLELYNTNNSIQNYQIISRLEKAIIELMESIASYMDDCYTLLKITSPKDEPKYNNVVLWLQKTNHPFRKQFFNSIKEYHDDVKKYINELKHHIGKLRIVVGKMGEKDLIIGYSLPYMSETPENEYAEILDLNDLNSLMIELKYHFYNVYLISEKLTEFMIKSIKHFYDFTLNVKKRDWVNEYETVFNRMNEKTFVTFPIEAKYDAPQIYISYEKTKLKIEKIGRSKENEKLCVPLNIKGKNPETHRIMLIPKPKILEEFNSHMKKIAVGESSKFEYNDSEDNVHKLYLTIYPNEDSKLAYMEYNFDDEMYIKIYGQWSIAFIFNSTLDYDKKHIVKFNNKLYDEKEPIEHLNLNWATGQIESIKKEEK